MRLGSQPITLWFWSEPTQNPFCLTFVSNSRRCTSCSLLRSSALGPSATSLRISAWVTAMSVSVRAGSQPNWMVIVL